jgi:hypothetical protein
LRVRRKLQILFRAVEAEIAQTESQRPIGLIESGLRGGGTFRQIEAHARALRTLARKYECYFAHLNQNSEEDRG